MSDYQIEDIEGIGPVYGEKLAACGITKTAALLERCGSAKGRKEVAAASGLSDTLLLKWVNMADLMRVPGVGSEFSELLEAAGVDTVKELAQRRADNLAAKMAEVNAAKRLTRRVPGEAEVSRWIEAAKTLPPAVSH
jgi:predicted flap endonuclease-1-like 5' DNA nuclease